LLSFFLWLTNLPLAACNFGDLDGYEGARSEITLA
jgi:hypothetical protein